MAASQAAGPITFERDGARFCLTVVELTPHLSPETPHEGTGDARDATARDIAAAGFVPAADLHAERIAELECKLAAKDACWHCKTALLPTKPRCETCPDECDDEACSEEGCREERAAATGPDWATREVTSGESGSFGCNPGDSAALLRLRAAINAADLWPSEMAKEQGDYEFAVRYMASRCRAMNATEDALNAARVLAAEEAPVPHDPDDTECGCDRCMLISVRAGWRSGGKRIAALETENAALKAELEQRLADFRDSVNVMVPFPPEPGSDMAKVMIANATMRRERDKAREHHERAMRDIRAAAKGESVSVDYDSGASQLVQELQTELARCKTELDQVCDVLYNTGATRGDALTRAKRAVRSYHEHINDSVAADEKIAALKTENERVTRDARRMHYLGNLIRSRTSEEQAEMNALMRRYPPLADAPKAPTPSPGAPGAGADPGTEKPREAAPTSAVPDSPGGEAGAWQRCPYVFSGILRKGPAARCNLRAGHAGGVHMLCGQPCPLLGDYCPECGVNGTEPPADEAEPSATPWESKLVTFGELATATRLASESCQGPAGWALVKLGDELERIAKVCQ